MNPVQKNEPRCSLGKEEGGSLITVSPTEASNARSEGTQRQEHLHGVLPGHVPPQLQRRYG